MFALLRTRELAQLKLIKSAIGVQAMTSILLSLAARREHIPTLREEIEDVVAEYGWTKEATGRMKKLDSFLKETSRLEGGGGCELSKLAGTPFSTAGYSIC